MLKIKKEFNELKVLLRSIPSLVIALFISSIIAMNLLANKSIVNLPWLCLDAGILLSWLAFLTMDVITKHFSLKAANTITIVAVVINLFICLLFFLASKIPGVWGESYVPGAEDTINNALDNTLGSAWYVVVGSTVAFIVSGLLNNLLNYLIGKMFKNKDNFGVFALRTYVSTAIGQFVDNMIFASLVSHFFFGWTWLQVVMCALTGMVAELLFEVVLSPLGYIVLKGWKKDNVGIEYFNLLNSYKESN